MILEIGNSKRLVLGGQTYRTAVRNRDGRTEFSVGLVPSVNIRSSVDAMRGKRITALNVKWLVWGAEVYAFALDGKPMPREGQE